MKRIAFLLLLLLSVSWLVFCVEEDFENRIYIFNAYYDDLLNPGFKFSMINGIFSLDIPETDLRKIEDGEYVKKTITEPYELIRKNGFQYIKTKDEKYIVLSQGEICILMSLEKRESFWGLDRNSQYVYLSSRIRENHIGIRGGMVDFQKVSSFLSETINNIRYDYNGISNHYYSLSNPWVEGVNGDGIGEWIQKRIAFSTDKVVIVNGYIDPSRPDLYTANSRVKKISIKNSDKKWQFDLLDSANPQIVTLPIKITGDIRFIIDEVYQGTKYADTAIAGIYFLE